MKIRNLLIVGSLLLLLISAPLMAQEEMPEPDLRIGGLPVSNGIPPVFAQLLGYFEEAGVTVELVPAASAQELREGIEAGELDGFQADLITTLVLIDNGSDLRLVRHAEITNHPDFAIVAHAASGIESAEDLRGASIAISTSTVVQYLADQLLASVGISPDEVEYVNVSSIFNRFEMLQQGEIQVALLPQPFIAHSANAGHHVLIDDSAAVYVPEGITFSAETLAEKGDAVRAFLSAYERVLDEANAFDDFESATAWFSAEIRASIVASIQAGANPALIETTLEYFTLHTTAGIWLNLSTARVPSEEEFAHAQDWALAAGLVMEAQAYEDVIDGSYLPEMMAEDMDDMSGDDEESDE